MQKTTMNLNPEIHQKLRILAIQRRTTFTKIVEQALQEFLEREGGEGRRRS